MAALVMDFVRQRYPPVNVLLVGKETIVRSESVLQDIRGQWNQPQLTHCDQQRLNVQTQDPATVQLGNATAI